MGEGSSRNMYHGHMDKANGGKFKGGRQGWMGLGHGGVNTETAVLEQQ